MKRSAKKNKELRRKKTQTNIPVYSAKPYPKSKFEGVMKHKQPVKSS